MTVESITNVTDNSSFAAFVNIIYEGVFTRLTFALLILLIGFIVGKLLNRVIRRVLGEIELNKIIKRTTDVDAKIEQFIASLTSWVIYIVTVVLALNQLGITSFVVNAISVIALLIIGIVIILGLKDFFPNLIAGVIIHSKKYIKEGDTITMQLASGKVTSIDLLETHIVTKKKDTIHIPNSYLLKHRLRVKS